MYKFTREKQISFKDFNQPLGLQMNPDNRWVEKAEMIPWETIEAEYAKLFPSYKERTGHYPERVFVDQIYRNRDNLSFCSSLGIRLSGKKLGRPKKDADSKADKKIAYGQML